MFSFIDNLLLTGRLKNYLKIVVSFTSLLFHHFATRWPHILIYSLIFLRRRRVILWLNFEFWLFYNASKITVRFTVTSAKLNLAVYTFLNPVFFLIIKISEWIAKESVQKRTGYHLVSQMFSIISYSLLTECLKNYLKIIISFSFLFLVALATRWPHLFTCSPVDFRHLKFWIECEFFILLQR